MKRMTYCRPFVPALVMMLACTIVPSADAVLIGTIPTTPGSTVLPGLVPAGADPGTLLASDTEPFTSTLGFNSGTLVSAVFEEAGGTLDFYYQVTNNMTAPECGQPGNRACDPLSRETNTDFLGFATSTGFRVDGASLPGGIFVDGTVAPTTADRNLVGGVLGFQFNPPDSAKIQPGEASNVLVISTDATAFRVGNASVIDGGVTTVAAFEPATVPEPASLLLLGGGLLALTGFRRFRA